MLFLLLFNGELDVIVVLCFVLFFSSQGFQSVLKTHDELTGLTTCAAAMSEMEESASFCTDTTLVKLTSTVGKFNG